MHPTTSEAYGARPLRCAPISAIPVGADDHAILEHAFPFMVYAFDWCSTFDLQRDWVGRARRLLSATQSKSIAYEFWTGAQAAAYATTAIMVGTAPTGTNFTGQVVSFSLAQDGGAPDVVTLNADYTNAAGVVAAINTQVAGSPASQTGGVITLTSPSSGGTSQILISGYTTGTVVTGLGNGVVSGEPVLDNTWLGRAGAVEVTTAGVSIEKAVAALDQAIAVNLANTPGMIHMTVECLSRAVSKQVLHLDGQLWRTAMGNVVVADGGYTGARDGETTGTVWAVATGPVEIAVGPIQGPSQLQTPADWNDGGVFDPSVNTVIVWAQRDALVMHEPHLLHAAAQIDLA